MQSSLIYRSVLVPHKYVLFSVSTLWSVDYTVQSVDYILQTVNYTLQTVEYTRAPDNFWVQCVFTP